MPKDKWGKVGKEIYECLRLGGLLQLTVADIIAATESTDRAAAMGDHNWWTSAKRGDKGFDGFTKCDLVL